VSETLDPDNINIKNGIDFPEQSWWHRVIGCPRGPWGHGQHQATREWLLVCGDQINLRPCDLLGV